jgi:hypothetical protein
MLTISPLLQEVAHGYNFPVAVTPLVLTTEPSISNVTVPEASIEIPNSVSVVYTPRFLSVADPDSNEYNLFP